jgi:hypothetical protein
MTNSGGTKVLDVEAIDLLSLSQRLSELLPEDSVLENYMEGKTRLRDLVVLELGCSALEAEQIVDTMVSRGFLHFRAAPESEARGGVWAIRTERA